MKLILLIPPCIQSISVTCIASTVDLPPLLKFAVLDSRHLLLDILMNNPVEKDSHTYRRARKILRI